MNATIRWVIFFALLFVGLAGTMWAFFLWVLFPV